MDNFDARLFMAAVRYEVRCEAGKKPNVPVSLRDLAALLRLEGDAFLEASYQRLLQRPLDPTGLSGYQKLARHRLGRIRILLSLLVSPEQSCVPPKLARLLQRLRTFLRKKA